MTGRLGELCKGDRFLPDPGHALLTDGDHLHMSALKITFQQCGSAVSFFDAQRYRGMPDTPFGDTPIFEIFMQVAICFGLPQCSILSYWTQALAMLIARRGAPLGVGRCEDAQLHIMRV